MQRHPALFTQEFIKADRAGRILVDTGRNARGATLAAAYAVRAKTGAPVSAPCTWEEVERGSVEPQTFGLRQMAERLKEVGDLWRSLSASATSLRSAMQVLESKLTPEDWSEAAAATTRRPKPRKRTSSG